MGDRVFKFEVENPRRCVRLRSSLGHMEHVANDELRGDDGKHAHETVKASTSRSSWDAGTLHETNPRDECAPCKAADHNEIIADDPTEQLNTLQMSTNAPEPSRRQQRRRDQRSLHAMMEQSDCKGRVGAEHPTRLERRSAKRALKASLNDRQFSPQLDMYSSEQAQVV